MIPRVVVATLTWNQKSDVLECLSSLVRLDYPNYEIVVVDNGSTDGSVEAITEQFPQVSIVRNSENLGCAEGVNGEIRYALKAGADYLFIIANDAVVESSTLKELVRVAEENPRAGIVSPKVYYYGTEKRIWFAKGAKFDWVKGRFFGFAQNVEDDGSFDKEEEAEFFPGGFSLVRVEAIKKAGLLDPGYFIYFDDSDWSYRIHRAGYAGRYAPKARAWHKPSSALGMETDGFFYYRTRNRLFFVKKYAPIGVFPVFLLYFLFEFVTHTLPYLYLNGRRPQIKAACLGIFDFICGKRGRRDFLARRKAPLVRAAEIDEVAGRGNNIEHQLKGSMKTENPESPDMQKELAAEGPTHVPTHRIHNFIHKVLQPHMFENLLAYVNWRIAINRGANAPPPTFGPVSINLDITTACNHYCHHCIDLELLNNGRKMDLQCTQTLINKLVEQGLKSVIVIGGGEPTVHPQFAEIISYLKSKNLQVGIVSNGTRVYQLVKAAPLLGEKDWMRLSLDAGNDESFAIIHNSKSPKTLTEIVHEVKQMRERWSGFSMGYSFLVLHEEFRGNGTSLKNNIKEIPEAAQLAQEHGFTYLSVKPFISPEASRITDPTGDYVEGIREQLQLAKRYETETFKVVESFNMFALLENQNERLRNQPRTCHSNFLRVVVTPDGIFSCPVWRGFKMVQLTPHDQNYSEDYDEYFNKNRLRVLDELNAKKECAKVTCIYNDLNWFIEDLIQNPEKLSALKTAVDTQDYFL
jgi:GT2 family glycosyltransferase/MoaA/NifB/PqqE/SkfB family radical SAM enzyme